MNQRTVFTTPAGRSSQGFTLIEMMIVVAMVAILAAIALPAYTDQIKKSRRAEAQAYMLAVAARQQQFLVDTRAYGAGTAASAVLPQPANVTTGYGAIAMTVVAGPPPTFTLTATPNSNQSSEKCGTLTINETGTKTAAVSGCW